jgi:ABC-2 type transport system permease protein
MQQAATLPPPRRFGMINGVGLWTLYQKEVRRFFKVMAQTVLAPVVTTLLYIVVFVIALAGSRPAVDGVPYPEFLAPGLIMMSVLSNAFQNSSSSLMIAKMQGTNVDYLMPPLSATELTLAFTLGAATRGAVVAIATALTLAPFIDVMPAHVWAVLYYGGMASLLLGALGILGGVWAEKFDHMAAIQNFVMLPLVFLSGSFYSIHRLPEAFQVANHFNPVFYLIDGFRYGFTGHHDGPVTIGAAVTFAATAAACAAAWAVLRSGWRLKS